MVHEDAACLLVLCEIATLVEATASGAVHVELGWPGELNDEAARSLRCTFGSGLDVALLEGDVLDPCKRVLDLVAGSVVVDVVRNARLFGRVENDQVHSALANATPGADGQGATVEVLDDGLARCGVSVEHQATVVREALSSGRPGPVSVHGQVLPH